MAGKKGRFPPLDQGENRRSSFREQDYELIWGRQPVREALFGTMPLQRIMLQEGSAGPMVAEVKQLAAQRRITLEQISRVQMDALVGGENHQGMLAFIAPYRYRDMDELLHPKNRSPLPPFLLILDHLQDPRNLGSLLRTAAAAAVDGVIIPRDRACGITPVVYKTSAGTVLNLPVARVVNIGREIDRLKERGFWIAGAHMTGSQPFYEADPPFPLALVMGGEGKGLSRLVREKCDLLLHIPMSGRVLSLNVAVAGGIIIYEIFRRRAGLPKRGD